MQKKSRYKSIIFDLDGTLIDSMPYHFKAFKATLKEHGVDMKDATLKHFMEGSTKKVLESIKKVYDFQGTVKDVREERRYHYFKALGKRKIIFPGTEKILKELKRDYKIAIATGSSRVTARYSINKRFQSLFDFIATINDVKKGKPHPEQLLLVAKKLKVKPSDCLMVGDSTYDMVAAKRAKMDSLGVLTGYHSKKDLLDSGAKAVLKNVVEIKSYLNES